MKRFLVLSLLVLGLGQSLAADVFYRLGVIIDNNLRQDLVLSNLFPGNSLVTVSNPLNGSREVLTVQNRSSIGRKIALSPATASKLGLGDGSIAELRLSTLVLDELKNPSANQQSRESDEYLDLLAGPVNTPGELPRGSARPEVPLQDLSQNSPESGSTAPSQDSAGNAPPPSKPAPSSPMNPSLSNPSPTQRPNLNANDNLNLTLGNENLNIPLPDQRPKEELKVSLPPPNPGINPIQAPPKRDENTRPENTEEVLPIQPPTQSFPNDSLDSPGQVYFPKSGDFKSPPQGIDAPNKPQNEEQKNPTAPKDPNSPSSVLPHAPSIEAANSPSDNKQDEHKQDTTSKEPVGPLNQTGDSQLLDKPSPGTSFQPSIPNNPAHKPLDTITGPPPSQGPIVNAGPDSRPSPITKPDLPAPSASSPSAKPLPSQPSQTIGTLRKVALRPGYYIQVASFQDIEKTKVIYQKFTAEYQVNIVSADVNGRTFYRCLIGSIPESKVAETLHKVRQAGFSDAFVYHNP